ncbi:MAG: hypothetical protein PVJ57_07000 [Phycisphaerae bacterium]|jgi:hypothetical protein
MTRARRLLVCLVGVVVILAGARGDSALEYPARRIFACASGKYGFNVAATVQRGVIKEIKGRLFTYDDKGNERTLWEHALPFLPKNVLVSNDGVVVSIDEWYRSGYAHSLVVIDAAGGVVADHALEAILTPGEIRDRVFHTVSNRVWASGAKYDFEKTRLVITLSWGERVLVDLATGEITRD